MADITLPLRSGSMGDITVSAMSIALADAQYLCFMGACRPNTGSGIGGGGLAAENL